MPKEENTYKHSALREAFKKKFNAPPDFGAARGLLANDRERLVRALTWLECAEDAETDDGKVLFGYIALNALFSRLGDDKIPEGENRQSRNQQNRLHTFVGKVAEADGKGVLLEFVCDNEPAIKEIISHPYLGRLFWESAHKRHLDWQQDTRDKLQVVDKCVEHARNWKGKKRGEKPWKSVRGDAKQVLNRVIDCVRVLRNQIVHGACCHRDGYNRSQMKMCAAFLPPLVARIIRIMLDAEHTGDDKWGKVAAPPQDKPDAPPSRTARPLPSGKRRRK